MRILTNLTKIFCFCLYFCSVVQANVLETIPNTGFKMLNAGTASGIGVPLIRNDIEDSRFPYWDSYCGAVNITGGGNLCWPGNPKNAYVYPRGTSKIVIELYMGNGYGNDNGVINLDDGSVATFHFHTYDTRVSRYYRMQFNSSVLSIDSSQCSRVPRKTSLMAGDNGASDVYLIESTARFATCRLVVSVDPSAADTRLSVSLNSIQARYDPNIYQKVPSGDWEVLAYWPDRMNIKTYSDENEEVETSQNELFNGVNIRFNLRLEGFFKYKLMSPSSQVIFFDPTKDKTKSFIFNSQLETNAPEYLVTIICENKIGQRCALKNSDQVLLPLDMGYRNDFLGGPTYRDFLMEGVEYRFSGNEKRNYPTGISFILNQEDVLRVERDNILNSRQFEGGATIIFEASF